MTNESSTESERIIFEQIQERYEFENKTSVNIDNSATNLVGWNGLIISVLLTGGGILISRGTTIKLDMFEWSLLTATLLGLALSLSLAIFAFRVGSYALIDPARVAQLYNKATASSILGRVGGSMLETIEYNSRRNERRGLIISISQAIFLGAMISAVIFLILQSYTLVV